MCKCSGQIALQVKSGVITHRIGQSSTSIDVFYYQSLISAAGLNIASYIANMQRVNFGFMKLQKTLFCLAKVS